MLEITGCLPQTAYWDFTKQAETLHSKLKPGAAGFISSRTNLDIEQTQPIQSPGQSCNSLMMHLSSLLQWSLCPPGGESPLIPV